ncbi:MAG: hypothetical protein QXG39_10495 [Candidatus Aenigmatarchaeota archaeon]
MKVESGKFCLKVYRFMKNTEKRSISRYIYLPKDISLLLNEPDAFEVHDIDTKEGILILKAVKIGGGGRD